MDSADHPHQRSITDYRVQGPPFVPPSEEEHIPLDATLHLQNLAHDELIETLIKMLMRDTDPGEEFMMEDIFNDVALGNVDRRVIGAVTNRAKKLYIIEHVGHDHSKIPGHHRLLKSVWRRV